MIYGENITDEMKSKWIDAGDSENILNSEISNGLNYSYHSKNQYIEFSFRDKNILNANITDDLLKLAFKGNFHYQDETLYLGGTNIRADRFQQYKLSYGRSINNFEFNVGASYLAGQHHLSYIIEKGSLYTSSLGTYLDIEYDMNAFATDTSNL